MKVLQNVDEDSFIIRKYLISMFYYLSRNYYFIEKFVSKYFIYCVYHWFSFHYLQIMNLIIFNRPALLPTSNFFFFWFAFTFFFLCFKRYFFAYLHVQHHPYWYIFRVRTGERLCTWQPCMVDSLGLRVWLSMVSCQRIPSPFILDKFRLRTWLAWWAVSETHLQFNEISILIINLHVLHFQIFVNNH